MISVSFGDRPADNIANVTLCKTAGMGQKVSPQAVEVLRKGTYVHKIIGSFDSLQKVEHVKMNIEKIIQPRGFKIKK